MCGRYTLINHNRILQVIQNFTLKVNLAAEIARWNIAPSQDILILTNRPTPTLEKARWGLIPSWAKDPAIGHKMINARAETLAEKPAFRTALAKRRCLIFASGFYEWRKTPGSTTRTPMYIHRKDDDLFAFAGLWETWSPPDGKTLESCTIITTAPNALLKTIHDRMPAILPPTAYAQWLDPNPLNPAALTPLLTPYPAEELTAHPVSTQVNNPRSEGPELTQPTKDSPPIPQKPKPKPKKSIPPPNQDTLF